MIRLFTSPTQKTGESGEKAAVSFLKKQGFSIVEQNVANKFGEIDIVAKKGSLRHFFEVKAGKEGGFINPAENLTPLKLRKFLISCEHYALVHQLRDYKVQAIIVLFPRDPKQETNVEIIDLF